MDYSIISQNILELNPEIASQDNDTEDSNSFQESRETDPQPSNPV